MKTAIRLIIVLAAVGGTAAGLWWGTNAFLANAVNIHELAGNGTEKELEYVLRWRPQRVHELDRFGRVPLHAAAVRKDSRAAQLLLEAGSLVNVRDRRNRTPLHEAAHKGALQTVQLLVQTGAEVNLADSEGWTPLFHAAASDRPRVVRILLKADAEVNITDETGETPLDWALLLFQQEESERLLRENGAKTRFELERGQLVNRDLIR